MRLSWARNDKNAFSAQLVLYYSSSPENFPLRHNLDISYCHSDVRMYFE